MSAKLEYRVTSGVPKMTLKSLLLIMTSVSLSAIAQTSFKYGLSRITFAPDTGIVMKIFSFLTSPFVFGGLSLYACGTVFWLFALRQMDLSLAYPFVSISFILVTISGILILGEPISATRMIGLGFIVTGLLIMASS